jgi:hypothetical protein
MFKILYEPYRYYRWKEDSTDLGGGFIAREGLDQVDDYYSESTVFPFVK